MARAMTDRERAVLAHKVVDPDEWYAHVCDTFGDAGGEAALDAKVERWADEYDAAVMAEGDAYMTRAERDEAEAP